MCCVVSQCCLKGLGRLRLQYFCYLDKGRACLIARGAKDFLGFLAFLPHAHFFFFPFLGLGFGFERFGPPKMPRSFAGPERMPVFLGPLKIAMQSFLLRGPNDLWVRPSNNHTAERYYSCKV